jgi:tryptophan 2,3-dioxygenase
MGSVVSLLRRIAEIQKLLIQQVSILETMTPLDFLDFRDYLFPASGFQSAQFRLVENRLGLRAEDRMKLGGAPYTSRFNADDMAAVVASEGEPSVFDLVEQWLERTPFLDHGDFSFWDSFQTAVKDRLEGDRAVIVSNPRLSVEEKDAQLKDFETTMQQYEALFDPAKHAEQQAAGKRRLSHRAFQAALFITLYRDQPALQEPYRLLELLMDIDEGFTSWRYRHAQMVLRMIGRRIGTGGSAGARYLEKSAERSRIFGDLYNLSTFLIPRADRPPLPPGIMESMRFKYEG